MCLLLETIKIENREIRNLEYHNRRFNISRKEKFGTGPGPDLSTVIQIPSNLDSETYRCRIIYDREIRKIEFIPHRPKTVNSLKLVYHDEIDYSLKYADRDLLMSLFGQRGDCDEILIIKKGFVTDTSISNIAFKKDDGSWVTPDTPLLNGTMRMYLLESGQIKEARIRPADLPDYYGAKMINCMMDLDSSPLIEIDNIFS